MAAAADGDYLVVWQGQHGSPRRTRIFGQFLGKAGNLVGGVGLVTLAGGQRPAVGVRCS